jgi:hypothetical protein
VAAAFGKAADGTTQQPYGNIRWQGYEKKDNTEQQKLQCYKAARGINKLREKRGEK